MGLWDGWRSRLFGGADDDQTQPAIHNDVVEAPAEADQPVEADPHQDAAVASDAPAADDFTSSVPGRQERAAGRILDDEGLRGDLTDDEFQPLLDWALSVTDKVAEATSNLDDEQAEPVLDSSIGVVRHVLRCAQDVVIAHAEGRADDRRYALDDISQAWKPSLVGGDDADAPRTVWQPLQALADRLDAESDVPGTEITAAIAATLSTHDSVTAETPDHADQDTES